MVFKRVLSLALTAAALLSLSACQSGETSSGSEDAAAPAGVAVQTQIVALDNISTENRVSGKVVTDDETSIMVAANAKCTAVYVEVGDTVRTGDVICTLDLASTQSSYNAANINYNATVQSYQDQKALFESQIALAEQNVNNLKALFEIGAASQLEIDNAALSLQQLKATRDSTLAQLQAGIQSGQSSLQQLETVLQDVDVYGNVIAPASGTLVSLSATENGYVSPSMPVAVIDGVDQMKISVSVSETLVPKLSNGDPADVTVSSLGESFTGAIRSVEKSANDQTKLYTVTISVPAEVTGLLAGMSADVIFRTDTSENTIVIPTEAILTNGETQYVYVVDTGETGDTARYVEIQTGLTGNGVTEVTSGLTAGEQLVTVGQSYLAEGDPVRVVSGEE